MINLKENRSLLYSIALHLFIVIAAVVKPYFSKDIKNFERVIRVDVVALPEKNQKIIKKVAQEKKVKEVQKKKEPKKPEKKKEPAKTSVVKKVEKTKKKKPAKKEEVPDTAASEMAALAKLKSLTEQEKVEEIVVKGNRVSKGSDLVGVEKIEYTNYKQKLHSAVSGEWDLPKWLLEGGLQALAEIKINEDGEVISMVIVKSSGNSIYDEKVMEAIGDASPFEPPPDKFKNIVLYEGVILTFP